MSRPVAAILARLRVPLGFALALIVLWAARPVPSTLAAGALVAAVGEGLRWWAAGHLQKGSEVTSSGPYRWTRHPLYAGSTIIGIGLTVICNSATAAIIILGYLGLTLTAAIRTEDAFLREKFGETYDAYRQGRTVARAFSARRALANREHRAVGGLALGIVLLFLRMVIAVR